MNEKEIHELRLEAINSKKEEMLKMYDLLAELQAKIEPSYINKETEDNPSHNQSRGHSITLATDIGKRMSDRTNDGGKISAIMLGLITLIFQLGFLALSIWIYK